jgi:hypothetical protein
MNPEIKQKWIDALRGGEYQQDKYSLKTSKGFCCLGVLTDLYLKEKNQDWEITENGYYTFSEIKDALSNEVANWCDFPYLNKEAILIEMNDDFGKTFQEIADYIEEYV